MGIETYCIMSKCSQLPWSDKYLWFVGIKYQGHSQKIRFNQVSQPCQHSLTDEFFLGSRVQKRHSNEHLAPKTETKISPKLPQPQTLNLKKVAGCGPLYCLRANMQFSRRLSYVAGVASVWSGQWGVKLAAACVFAAGRPWPGLGRPPNRCWFVSGLWLNSWTAFQHTGERRGGLELWGLQLHRQNREREEGERQIKRKRLEANDAALNTKDSKLRDLPSLITIMQTSSRHRK